MREVDVAFQPQIENHLLSGKRTGFRLSRFEVFNWGTFHQRVWGIDVHGENALLTGDIGSGKSTFVDAITTLLVPPQKVNYNKAAGAEARERTPRTYVLGHYKSERAEYGSSAKPVPLRDENSYSVVLGRFHNEELGQTVTLAVVFWFKERNGQPARFYLIADTPLSIVEHFDDFGSDINNLRKRLRKMASLEIYDNFPPYGAAYRRRFGIENEQALDLFNQTVSMKSVGNLTEFVREHMLEAFPVEERISALIGHFDDLNQAHEAVLKAKDQIARLTPLIADCDALARLTEEVKSLRMARECLRPWFAQCKKALLEKRIANLDADLEKLAARIDSLARNRNASRVKRDEIRQAISEQGGDSIEGIKKKIAEILAEKDERQARAMQYDDLARAAGLPPAVDAETFVENQQTIKAEQELTINCQAEKQNAITEIKFELRKLEEQRLEMEAELVSLAQRRSNIPRHMLDLRSQLCAAAGLKEETIPFAGELIQVLPEHRDWEGAIERRLHNLGLSLLVSDQHYAQVTEWVDQTHLRGRLVYYRMRDQRTVDQSSIPPASMVRKVAIKPDSPCYRWLETELALHYNYICCDTLAQFRREPQAMTRAGQFKGRGGERHEKDDRHAINDRSRFVLGWSNEEKIAVLRKQAADLMIRISDQRKQLAGLEGDARILQTRFGKLQQLSVFHTFHDLEWKPLVIEVEQLEKERRELEEASDVLRALQQQLAGVDKVISDLEEKLESQQKEQARLQERRKQANDQLGECDSLLARTPEDIKANFLRIEEMSREMLKEHTLTVESCDNRERDMRDWIQARIDAEDKKINKLSEKIVEAMVSYRKDYPLETQEADASVAAAPEYRKMLDSLISDDLPRFEARFKRLLNENAINEVANFHSQLNRERETIGERINTINNSLRDIPYNPGRYIVLEFEQNPDAEIRDFRQDLRACTEGALTGSENDEYSESKFLQVKRIIDRFRGREGSSELDRRWTQKVTDVRHWFVFSASERWREDDREFEHYTDSGGKSGGQKEKLAYTVLAASLAYQFGLERGHARSRSFRFVVIDEAFGRGSDESARYGLELFKRLDLQLLIVTPLQKIHIIEPHVANVGFVHSEDGKLSMLRNLTIEEYRAERAPRA